MAIKHMISPGIGYSPGSVKYIVTRGLTSTPPVTKLIALTLDSRSTALTLENRAATLTLDSRSTDLTLEDRE